MTDESTTEATPEQSQPEHAMEVSVMTSNGFGTKVRQSEDVFVTCPCGWRYNNANNQRDARRAFERHLRKVEKTGSDGGNLKTAPDDPKAVLARHRGV